MTLEEMTEKRKRRLLCRSTNVHFYQVSSLNVRNEREGKALDHVVLTP